MLTQLWGLFVDLWETGNWWARVVLSALLAYPLLLVILAYAGVTLTLGTITLVFLLMFAFAMIARVDPLIVGIIASDSQGRAFLKFVAVLIATESLAGVFFSVVPASANPELSSLLLLVVICIGLLSVAITSSLEVFAKRLTKILMVVGFAVVVVLLVSSLFPRSFNTLEGVVEKADAKVERLLNPPPPVSKAGVSEISARPVVWYPEPFPLPEPGKFVPTVTNLDTSNFEPASYRVWAKKGEKYVRYRLLVTDPKTNIQAEVEMGPGKQWIHGSGGGIGQFPVAANESGVTFWAERVPRKFLNKRTM